MCGGYQLVGEEVKCLKVEERERDFGLKEGTL